MVQSRTGKPSTGPSRLWYVGCVQGPSVQVDIEIEGARPRSPCEGSQEAVHSVVLVAIHQETLIDGTQKTTSKSFSCPP
jgi:hypothetical protein